MPEQTAPELRPSEVLLLQNQVAIMLALTALVGKMIGQDQADSLRALADHSKKVLDRMHSRGWKELKL